MKSASWAFVVVAILLLSCGGARGGKGSEVARSYEAKIRFSGGDGEELVPVRPDEVTVYEKSAERPAGLYFGNYFTVARDYPSASNPHRDVGSIELDESVKYQVGDDIWADPDVVAKRNELLKKAAAERGANAVFLMHDQLPEVGQRNVTYRAVALSSAEPSFPSVAEVLAKLGLEKDGFKEVKRFTATMEELPTRKPERIQLKAGHEYQLAMAFHPEPVELGLEKGLSLAFLVSVEKDVVNDSDRQGTFIERIDKQYENALAFPGVDGVFARGGAGTMGGNGRSVKVEMAARAATIKFNARHGIRGPQPLTRLGKGKADFVIYERRLSAEQLADEVCGWCMNAAKSCSKREPLQSCEKLRSCFVEAEQPLSMCKAKYKDL